MAFNLLMDFLFCLDPSMPDISAFMHTTGYDSCNYGGNNGSNNNPNNKAATVITKKRFARLSSGLNFLCNSGLKSGRSESTKHFACEEGRRFSLNILNHIVFAF